MVIMSILFFAYLSGGCLDIVVAIMILCIYEFSANNDLIDIEKKDVFFVKLSDNLRLRHVTAFFLVFVLCFSLMLGLVTSVTFSDQGSDSSDIGTGGGTFSPPSGEDQGGSYTGGMYYAAPGVTMQVVYYPYGESYNGELAYGNVLNSVQNHTAYDINGNEIQTIYNGEATTDYVFFAESASGRIYRAPGYDKNTRNGIIHACASRYETAGVGDDMLSPLHHDCISGSAVVDKTHAGTSSDPWVVTMPEATDVEKFIRHIIFGQGFGEWNKSSIALTSTGAEASAVTDDISTYANVLRLLGTSEQGIQNYIDAYTGKLSKTDDYNVMVPTIIWTYIVVECGYDKVWSTGNDWSVTWSYNGLGDDYVGEYFIYKDNYAYCCDGSAYAGEGGTHGTIDGNKFQDTYDVAFKYRVFTVSDVVTYSHAASAVKKGYGQARANAYAEVLWDEFWAMPHATMNDCSYDYRRHVFDSDHTITYMLDGSPKTVTVSAGDEVGYNEVMCEWYIERSWACRWMFGEHNWHKGGRIDYYTRHAHSTGKVNYIRSDYAGTNGTQYYLRGFWTPFNEQVSGGASINKTSTAADGSVNGYCFKFENTSTGDVWYGKSDSNGNIYQTDSSWNQLGGTANYSFTGMFNGEYVITEVLSQKGAGSVLPDYFGIKVVNEAGVTTVNTTITGDDIKISGDDAYVVVSLAGLTGHTTGGKMTLTINNASSIVQGEGRIKKSVENGTRLDGWLFDIYDANGSLVVNGVATDASGLLRYSLDAGVYTIYEVGHKESAVWNDPYLDKSVINSNGYTIEIKAGETTELPITNVYRGKLSVTKTTNTGKNLKNWKFEIRDNTGALVETITTDANGYAESGLLKVGQTYSVTEVTGSDSYWSYDTQTKSVKIVANATTNVTFTNNHYGRVSVTKTTNTGANLSGWVFDIKNSSGTIVATITTDANGKATSGNLAPGSYTVVERANSSSYWVSDIAAKSVTVTAGQTASVTVNNMHYGRIRVVKTTNTGANLNGWVFDIKDSAGTIVATLTTDANGVATSGNLLPGNYTVVERASGSAYWVSDVSPKSVTVVAGSTKDVTANNMHYGRITISKTTNTGVDKDNWVFTVYTDSACTKVAKDKNGNAVTMTTNTNGTAVSGYLLPGNYYVKETGGTRWSDTYYWTMSTEVKTVKVIGGVDTAASGSFANTHYGRFQVIKAMDTDGSVSGWQFKVVRESDGADMGIYTTDANGQFVTDKLLPGRYVVTEIIDEVNGYYYCETMNPVIVTVAAGQTKLAGGTERAGVSFVNALRPMKIVLDKINHVNQPLSGVVFSLEWSVDGVNWQRVKYSSAENVVAGNCGSTGLGSDGTLVTDANGHLEFVNLYPGIYYRVTEESTLNGYTLLTAPYDIAPNDVDITTLTYDMTVVNTPGYGLPETGSVDAMLLPMVGVFAAVIVGGMIVGYLFRKKRSV